MGRFGFGIAIYIVYYTILTLLFLFIYNLLTQITPSQINQNVINQQKRQR
jgi:hypothetical protein